MSIHELRDPEAARLFLLQGLWLQRVLPPREDTVRPALEWALEVAAAGEPLWPIGVLADVAHVALGVDHEMHVQRPSMVYPGLSAGLARTYEDYVLGKLYADSSFERAADALHRYEGVDKVKGLAFVLNQFRQRSGSGGVLLSPAAIKANLSRRADEVLAEGWTTLDERGLLPLLPELYEEIISAVRNMPEVLGPEDVFELENRTALQPFGQRVALRQVLQAAAVFESGLPRHRVRSLARKQEVPTRVLDEDTYPVGGFSSISTRGSIESLLYSQLALMEPNNRPDLFDVKYLRDELLYYSRDENQFLRRRRTFVFALYPDLVQARFKDAELPYQRIVLLLALLVVAVRKLAEWLSTDALVFEFVFIDTGNATTLAAEEGLLHLLFPEQIAHRTVVLHRIPPSHLVAHCALRSRRSLCHCLTMGLTERPLQAEGTVVARLVLDGPRPALGVERETVQGPDTGHALAAWSAVLEHLLQLWV
jgi:hypothetical protein